MATFNVLARDVSFRNYQVEAETAEEAEEKVLEGDHEGFEIVDGGEWEVVSTTPEKEA